MRCLNRTSFRHDKNVVFENRESFRRKEKSQKQLELDK